MKITIYELLGLIKDGKAPKKIKYKNNIYEYDGEIQNYCSPINMVWDFLIGKDIVAILDDEVEILNEAKEDKIQKIYHFKTSLIQNEVEILITKNLNQMVDKINELIDEINNLKEK